MEGIAFLITLYQETQIDLQDKAEVLEVIPGLDQRPAHLVVLQGVRVPDHRDLRGQSRALQEVHQVLLRELQGVRVLVDQAEATKVNQVNTNK